MLGHNGHEGGVNRPPAAVVASNNVTPIIETAPTWETPP